MTSTVINRNNTTMNVDLLLIIRNIMSLNPFYFKALLSLSFFIWPLFFDYISRTMIKIKLEREHKYMKSK
jgi:hypothetical protein